MILVGIHFDHNKVAVNLGRRQNVHLMESNNMAAREYEGRRSSGAQIKDGLGPGL